MNNAHKDIAITTIVVYCLGINN